MSDGNGPPTERMLQAFRELLTQLSTKRPSIRRRDLGDVDVEAFALAVRWEFLLLSDEDRNNKWRDARSLSEDPEYEYRIADDVVAFSRITSGQQENVALRILRLMIASIGERWNWSPKLLHAATGIVDNDELSDGLQRLCDLGIAYSIGQGRDISYALTTPVIAGAADTVIPDAWDTRRLPLIEVYQTHIWNSRIGAIAVGARASAHGRVEEFPVALSVAERPCELRDPQYFVYLSAVKAEMLYAQAQVALGLPAEASDISKVSAIERWLQERGKIGTIETPLAYFAGELTMRWGKLRDGYESNFRAFEREASGGMVLFSGRRDEALLIALVGSSVHLVGNGGSAPAFTSHYVNASHWQYIIDAAWAESDCLNVQSFSSANIHGPLTGALAQEGSTSVRVRFLAKTFCLDRKCLVGSPIFVCLAD